MQPSRTIWETFQDLLAADTGTLAAVAAMHVHLAAATFIPSLDLSLASLVEATFTGGAAKNAGIGTAQTYYNVTTGRREVQILEPAGGWTWICTVAPAAPETIFGFYLTDNADAVLFGAELLATPITIQAVGQAVILPYLRMSFLTNSPV